MAVTRTFSIIKPDATRRNLTGAVTAKLEEAGLRVVASKRLHLTREQAARLGYPNDTKGALVLAVTRDSVADKAGVRAGLVIVKVDTTAIESAAGFKQALGTSDREKGAMVRLLRPSGEVEFAVLPVP